MSAAKTAAAGTRAITLLRLADQQGQKSLHTYIAACEALFAGYDKDEHGTVEEYMRAVTKEAARRKVPAGRVAFFNLWGVGQALKDGRATRTELLKFTSRAELHRNLPRKRAVLRPQNRRPRCHIWVSVSVHEQLMKLAARYNESAGDAVERLLAQAPAATKKAVKKAA